MPDGTRAPDERTDGERAADEADAALVRRVRRNLVLWSGLTTLVILVVARVGAVPRRRRLAGQLRDGPARCPHGPDQGARERPAAAATGRRRRPVRVHLRPGLGHVRDDPRRGRPAAPAAQLPGPAGAAGHGGRGRGARPSGRDVRTAEIEATPIRLLTEPIQDGAGTTFLIQVVQDRTAEQQTLAVMLVVLLVGGLVVVVVAFGFGTVYARRALVPIRESLATQRVGAPSPARLRRRCEPRAADAAHRHPQQRRAPRAATGTSRSPRSAPRSRTSTTRSGT